MQNNDTMNSNYVSLLLKTAQNCCDILQSDASVLAVYLIGSLAHGTADANSDIDLCVIVDTEKLDVVLSNAYATAEKVGQLLVIGQFPDSTSLTTLYDVSGSIVKVDFDYLGFDQVPDVIAKSLNTHTYLFHRQLLYDRVGTIENLFGSPASRPCFQHIDNSAWFIVSSWSVLRMTRRGELLEAVDILNHMRDPVLTRLLCSAYDVPFENYRRIEVKLPDHIVDHLRQTMSTPSVDGILHSLGAIIRLYINVRKVLHEDIPSNEHATCVRVLEEIKCLLGEEGKS